MVVTAPTDINRFAEVVATEIRQAFTAYNGARWYTDDEGYERALPFTVEAPSLSGQDVRELDHLGGSWGDVGRFASYYLYAAGGESVCGGGMRGRILHGIHAHPEIQDGKYTGKVSVRDASGAWDFDL